MAMDNRASGTPVIIMTLYVAAILEVMPLPGPVEFMRPEFLTLVLVYWVIALPHRIGVAWGLAAGLFQDVLTGSLLGQHALALSVLAYLAQLSHKRMRVFPPIQQSLVLFLMAGVTVTVSYIVQDAAGRAHVPPWLMLSSALTSALLWRPVFNSLRWLRRRFLVR